MSPMKSSSPLLASKSVFDHYRSLHHDAVIFEDIIHDLNSSVNRTIVSSTRNDVIFLGESSPGEHEHLKF